MSYFACKEFLFRDQKGIPGKRIEGQLKKYESVMDRRIWSNDKEEQRKYILEYISALPTEESDGSIGRIVPVKAVIQLLMDSRDAHIEELQRQVDELNKFLDQNKQNLDPEKQKALEKLRKDFKALVLKDESPGLFRSLGPSTDGIEGTFVPAEEDLLFTGHRKVTESESESEMDDSNLKEMLVQKESEIIALKNKLAACQIDISDKDLYLMEAIKKLDHVHEIISENKDLVDRLASSDIKIKSLLNEKERLKKEKEEALAVIKAMEEGKKRGQAAKDLAGIQTEINKIAEGGLSLDETLLKDELQKLKDYCEQMTAIEEERNILAGKAAQLDSLVNDLKKENAVLEEQKKQLQEVMTQSGTSPGDDEFIQLKNENIDLKSKLKVLDGIKSERDKLLNENSALKQQQGKPLEALQQKLDEYKAKVKELEDQEKELLHVKGNESQMVLQIEDLRNTLDKYADMEKKLQELKKKADEADELKKRLEELLKILRVVGFDPNAILSGVSPGDLSGLHAFPEGIAGAALKQKIDASKEDQDGLKSGLTGTVDSEMMKEVDDLQKELDACREEQQMMKHGWDKTTGNAIAEGVSFVDEDIDKLLKDCDAVNKAMETAGVKNPAELLAKLESLKSIKDANRGKSSVQLQLDMLKKEHDMLKMERDAMAEERNVIQIQANQRNSKLYELQADNAALKQELESWMRHKAGCPMMDDKINVMMTERNALMLRVSELEAELQELNNKASILPNIIAERDMLLLRLNDFAGMQGEIEKLQFKKKEVEVLKVERDKMKMRLHELESIEKPYHELLKKTRNMDLITAERDLFKSKYEEVAVLQSEVDKLRNCVERLKEADCERNQLKRKVKELECAIADQEDEIKRLLIQVDQLSLNKDKKQEQLNKDLSQLQNILFEKNARISECECQLANLPQLKTKIGSLQHKNEVLKTEKQCCQMKFADIEEELNKALEKLKEKESELSTLQSHQQESNQQIVQYTKVEENMKAKVRELQQCKEELDDLRIQNLNYKNENSKLLRDTELLKEKLVSLIEENKNLNAEQERRNMCRLELEKVTQEFVRFKEKVKKKLEECEKEKNLLWDTVKSEKEDLKKQLENAEFEKHQLNCEYEDKISECECQLASLPLLEAEIGSLQHKNEVLKTEKQCCQKKFADLEKELNKALEKLKEKENELCALQSHLQENNQQIVQHTNIEENMKIKIRKLQQCEEELDSLRVQNLNYKDDNSKLIRDTEQLKEKLVKFVEKNKKLQQYEEELDSLRVQNLNFKDENSKLLKDTELLKEKLANLVEENKNIKAEQERRNMCQLELGKVTQEFEGFKEKMKKNLEVCDKEKNMLLEKVKSEKEELLQLKKQLQNAEFEKHQLNNTLCNYEEQSSLILEEKEEIIVLKQIVAKLEAENNDLKKRLEDFKQNCVVNAEKVKENIQNLQKELSHVQSTDLESLEFQDEEKVKLESVINRSKDLLRLKNPQEESEKLLEVENSLTKEVKINKVLSEKLRTLSKQLEDKHGDVSQLRSYEKEIKNLEESNNKVKAKNEEMINLLQATDNKLSEMFDKINVLHKENSALKVKNLEVLGDVAKYKRKIEELVNKNKNHEAEIENLRSSYDENMSDLIDFLDKEKETMERSHGESKEKLLDLQEKEREEIICHYEHEIQILENNRSRSEEEKVKLRKKFNVELQQLRDKVQELTSELQEIKQKHKEELKELQIEHEARMKEMKNKYETKEKHAQSDKNISLSKIKVYHYESEKKIEEEKQITRSSTEPKIKEIVEKIDNLCFGDLSYLHQQICKAACLTIIQDSPSELNMAAIVKCWPLDKAGAQELLRQKIASLENEITEKQKETEKKVIHLESFIQREKRHIEDLQNQLKHQTRSCDLSQKHSSYHEDCVCKFIVQQKARIRQIEDDLQKARNHNKQLEAERMCARCVKLQDSASVEKVRQAWKTAMSNEKKLGSWHCMYSNG